MKKILIISFLLLAILISFLSTSYANTAITEETLENSFKEIMDKLNDNSTSTELIDEYTNINFDKVNKEIKISTGDEVFNLNYDLSEQPTFSLEIPIKKGMSYDDFKKQTDNLVLPMFGYIAIANIQGASPEDASMYFFLSYLESNLSSSSSSKNSYIIVDDLNLSDGVTIETKDDSKTIYTSEFGNRVMEYVNYLYQDKQSTSDSSKVNSYSFTIERQDVTDTSCKLVSTLRVKSNADFLKIKEYTSSFTNNGITKEDADYTIELKVGQKCKIETSKKITGYGLYGQSCIDFSEDFTEITATSIGIQNGYLYIGNEKKSVYIIVEKNTENKALDTITLKIDSPTNQNIEKGNTTSQNIIDSYSKIPQTGHFFNVQDILFILILISIIGIIVLTVPNAKYRNINKNL